MIPKKMMLTTRKCLQLAVAMVAGGMLSATAVNANPIGVPVAEPGPFQCTTPNFTITAVVGDNGEFPQAVNCVSNNNTGKTCSLYAYDISSPTKNVDHAVLVIPASLNLDSTNPTSPPTGINPPGAGASLGSDNFLSNALHEYTLTYNAADSKNAHVEYLTVGTSSPRISTVLIKSGARTIESCLIAGAGVLGNPFKPVSVEQTVLAAGGKCKVKKIFNVLGNMISLQLTPDSDPICVVANPDYILVQGETVRDNVEMTIGDNTTTCYGPPVPSKPWCVCTKSPCP